jgi:hypothetical protein
MCSRSISRGGCGTIRALIYDMERARLRWAASKIHVAHSYKNTAFRISVHYVKSPFLAPHTALIFPPAASHVCSEASVCRRIEVMFNSNDVVRCTVRDGEMWMHLDNESLKVPPQLLSQSQVLMDALSAAYPSATRKVTVAAPKEWLQAWVGCFCNEEESLSCHNIKDLINCLLVRFFLWNAVPVVRTFATCTGSVFTAWCVLSSSARSPSRRLIPMTQLLVS